MSINLFQTTDEGSILIHKENGYCIHCEEVMRFKTEEWNEKVARFTHQPEYEVIKDPIYIDFQEAYTAVKERLDNEEEFDEMMRRDFSQKQLWREERKEEEDPQPLIHIRWNTRSPEHV